jgi:hypothetical protein
MPGIQGQPTIEEQERDTIQRKLDELIGFLMGEHPEVMRRVKLYTEMLKDTDVSQVDRRRPQVVESYESCEKPSDAIVAYLASHGPSYPKAVVDGIMRGGYKKSSPDEESARKGLYRSIRHQTKGAAEPFLYKGEDRRLYLIKKDV